jgi:tetratricopeptide (TPR) repeat protein
MVRVIPVLVLLAAPLASGQVSLPKTPTNAPTTDAPPPSRVTSPQSPLPTSRPVSPPATKPSPAELHAQAVEFMRQEKFDKATPLLNRAYNETPAAQRSRPLILNRALLDLVQKGNLPRAIKDLSQYFARNPAPDEEASNLLGSILELASQNARWRDGPLYAEAFREFARRETTLERHRPGYKRWGPKWITQGEFDDTRRKDDDLMVQIADQGEVVRRITLTVTTLTDQYNTAATRARGFSNHVHVRRYNDPIVINPTPCAICAAMAEAAASVRDISADLNVATGELDRATRTYKQLQTRAVKPTWPTRYSPIDPNAPPPKPPEHPALAALAATTEPTPNTPDAHRAAAESPSRVSLPPATRPSDLVR